MRTSPIVSRKEDHLRIVAEKDVEYEQSTLLDKIKLVHQALPELNLDDIDTSVEFFGKRLRFPLMITSMTGGAKYAKRLNQSLAEAAKEAGIALGLGSQRVLVSHPELTNDFAVRSIIGDGVLLGNIGAIQLNEYSPKQISELADGVEADGMCVHLNAAQELVQGEKNQQQFSGLLDGIARLMDEMDGKILVKETGAGLSPRTLEKLVSIGVPYIDVAGAGGTSWSKVEYYRAVDSMQSQIGKLISDWGIPTAFSTIAARKIAGEKATIIGSGGVRNGLDVANVIAAGAKIAGFARPVLLAYFSDTKDGIGNWLSGIEEELRSLMFLTGSKNVDELNSAPRIYTGELREWLATYGYLDGVKS